MIVPGRSLIPKIISNVRSAAIQAQPCSVDLSLKRLLTWTSPATIDFDNSRRAKPQPKRSSLVQRSPLLSACRDPYEDDAKRPLEAIIALSKSRLHDELDCVMLATGSYLVEFNETVHVPLDLMG